MLTSASQILMEYENGWAIERRLRNNHEGYKLWLTYKEVGVEEDRRDIASYDERGLRKRDGSSFLDRNPIPKNVLDDLSYLWGSGASEADCVGYTISICWLREEQSL